MSNQDYLEHLREIRVRKKAPPKSMAEMLSLRHIQKAIKKRTRVERVADAWLAIADSLLAEHSEVVSLRAGKAHIAVTSQAMASELATYRSRELLELLNTELDGKDRVSALVFKAGGRR